MRSFLLGLVSLSLFRLSFACSEDNCLRAFQRQSTTALSFCSTYTKGVSTVTTALPPYATQCKDSPSRISSACSCIATAPPTKCTPSLLKDPTFTGVIAGGNAWTATINKNPTQTIFPEYSFFTNFFEVDFPNFQPNPFLSTLTLSQSGLTVCNGINSIMYQYGATINAIAINPVPQKFNCSVTATFDNVGYAGTTLYVTWVTDSTVFNGVNVEFPITGLPDAGKVTDFRITISCPLADWWPEIQLSNIAVNTEFKPS